MRKRIVIGLLAIVVISVGAFVLTRPKEGSIEWHRRKYLAAWDRQHENTLVDRLKRKYHGVTRTTPRMRTTVEFHEHLKAMQKNLDEIREHREALVRLGYLIERQFVLSSRHTNNMATTVWKTLGRGPEVINGQAWMLSGTNLIFVSAPRNMMPKYEKLIYKLDMPETGK